MSELTIQQRIRTLVDAGKMSRSAIARAAGLHANSLRDCTEPQWNPTAETLGKLEAFLEANDDRPVLASIEEIIDEARNGRMYILVDDEDRENEGDLIIPAQMATPAAINFMAMHGRGLICLSLTRARCDQLGLEPMSRNNRELMQTAFTTSIEAREGVTTGISAADRARTVSVAIDSSKGPDDIVTPGHVFPLVARDGGVLVRAGHTEAAVDISRLAGLNPSGVICEIMNEDGTMARLDDLVGFARRHDLKIGTIRDLIAYRLRHDHFAEMRAEARFSSRWGGDWTALAFYNSATGTEQIVLRKGHVDPARPTLVRMHALDMFNDIFGKDSPDDRVLAKSMEIIGREGAGIIVMIPRASGGFIADQVRKLKGEPTEPMDALRDYGVGAQILNELGVHEMELLTNSDRSLVALDGYGVSIVGKRAIDLD
ncbi:3,4-dihydroxy-2-butanone-4-phosphate synthase [Parerythrobacter lacustris]|uniref:3,4-dihydroxy-2-butanone 4-phosphate synthase n=1 Tax=Parerythrobacter lacustris TaxID=2969984 RepID=A0ABT1XND4_9SPHN|nr:3,4-dihydroxy-2-butanone-4-phosphate synthase [Parerythrobacter lacustris]MCR2833082.1 3,4-dihydroxy-2-butanone-4-phosphate synthase [Parerythrobacter lacustris]